MNLQTSYFNIVLNISVRYCLYKIEITNIAQAAVYCDQNAMEGNRLSIYNLHVQGMRGRSGINISIIRILDDCRIQSY